MPDHVHWLLQLVDDASLSACVSRMKAAVTRDLPQDQRPVWQRGFYDRAIRREQDVKPIARYIIGNPVRAGLVERVGEYPFWWAAWL